MVESINKNTSKEYLPILSETPPQKSLPNAFDAARMPTIKAAF